MIVNAADFHVRPYAQGYKGFERTKNNPCKTERKFIRITRMELIFNARQLSRCPELPAGNGNYARWQKFAASSSEQWRNPCLQDGKTLEGLQARPDPVYEPMSVSYILRLCKKNPVGLRNKNPAGFIPTYFSTQFCFHKMARILLYFYQICSSAPLASAVWITSST